MVMYCPHGEFELKQIGPGVFFTACPRCLQVAMPEGVPSPTGETHTTTTQTVTVVRRTEKP